MSVGEVEAYAATFNVLGNTQRLRLLLIIAANPGITASTLHQHVTISQPTISHHIRQLVGCELVTGRKVRSAVLLTVNPAKWAAVLAFVTPFTQAVAAPATPISARAAKPARKKAAKKAAPKKVTKKTAPKKPAK